MQFYKIYGEIIKGEEEEKAASGRHSKRDFSHNVQLKTTEFNSGNNAEFCFVSEIDEDYAIFGVIATRRMNFVNFAKKYAKFIGLNVNASMPDEITFANLENYLSRADRQGYIEDDDEIFRRFGLDRLTRRRGIEFGENLINFKAEKDTLFESARQYFMNETMIPELERIYSNEKIPYASGHPVHYIVETDDRDTRREIYKILLDALYANCRLDNQRYAFLDFHSDESYSKAAFESLYKTSEGGAVVIRYFAEDASDDSDESTGEVDTIINICDIVKRYRNKVLTILCFPRECKKIKAQFYENLGSMSFIEIREDFIDGKKAREFLSGLAKNNHVRTDKRLFRDLIEDSSYLSSELVSIFDEWYDVKLKTTVYPQYKDMAVAHREVVKAKPMGSAYDQLFEMIGLTEAKAVIKKSLNYYKMEKLYEERGVKKNNPAMHMIFTGNPGTAKTTVARLFARIMKENNLLSKGQIIEVGRGDLVGKYVGWTAKTVQEKFRAARGGVLFIDEAYSLVDGRDGSFGDEAINTIVQEMENNRSEVVVIFAGYPDKMESFVNKNPGLRSRIAFHVPFADYTSEELCQIAEMVSRKNGMKFEEGAMDKLGRAFDAARATTDFGNGRYVRNLFEQAKMNQASRLLEKDFNDISTEDIVTITADDIVIPQLKSGDIGRIGFC